MSSQNPCLLTRPQRSAVTRRVLWGRAGGRCECRGDCGTCHPEGHRRRPSERCPTRDGDVFPGGVRSFVTLTFLNGNTHDYSEKNLLALCNACRARWMARQHAATNPAVPEEKHPHG